MTSRLFHQLLTGVPRWLPARVCKTARKVSIGLPLCPDSQSKQLVDFYLNILFFLPGAWEQRLQLPNSQARGKPINLVVIHRLTLFLKAAKRQREAERIFFSGAAGFVSLPLVIPLRKQMPAGAFCRTGLPNTHPPSPLLGFFSPAITVSLLPGSVPSQSAFIFCLLLICFLLRFCMIVGLHKHQMSHWNS